MTIGGRIKKRRLELNLTVDEVANRLNKNRATIYRYENEEIENLPTSVLEPLASVLETTPAYLMGWDELVERADEKADAAYLVYENEELEKLVMKCSDMDTITIRRMLRYADLLKEEDEL